MVNTSVGQVLVPNALLYVPGFLSGDEADAMLSSLNVETRDAIKPTNSGVRHMGRFGATYTYMGRPLPFFPWTPTLESLRDRVQTLLDVSLNACVVNRYPTGEHFLAPHSDTRAIPQLGKEPCIPCVSFGASRMFVLTPKSKKLTPTSVIAGHGDLLVMFGESQSRYLHSIPKEPECVTCRLSVTFRFHS